MSLESLGMTVEQERLYRRLLREPGAAAEASPVLGELRELGLVDTGHAAVPPAAAVDLLVRRRIDQTRRHLTAITRAWDVLTELTAEFGGGRSDPMVEHLPDRAAVSSRILAALTDDPGEFAALRSKPRAEDPLDDATRFALLLSRGLRSRTLVAAEALSDSVREGHARHWHSLGDAHRVTTEVIRCLAIVNRTTAFVHDDAAGPGAGALQIRRPGLVALLAEVFDGMWARARDLDEPPLSPIEQQVLEALARHDKDETAARSIAVSVRKFRSHVAVLQARLGARTRFQAALLAKERGWL